jgi:DNA topoisomerase-3
VLSSPSKIALIYFDFSKLKLTRASILFSQIHTACRNPVALDMLQANAVAARIDLDLRVGAAMTRTQTLGLQARFPGILENVISYGE